MAVSTTENVKSYSCDGSQTDFDFPFSIIGTDTSVLKITIWDNAGVVEPNVLSEGSGDKSYTADAPNSDYKNGGTISTTKLDGAVYVAYAWSSDYTITIERIVPYTQTSEFTAGGLSHEALEQTFDHQEYQIQQLNQRKSIHAPPSDLADLTYELPMVSARKNKVIGFDASGNVIAVANVPTSGVSATAFMETLLDDVTAAAARATLELGTTLGWTDVRAYLPSGFVSDGSVDYATEVQACITENRNVLWPEINIGLLTALNVPAQTQIKGVGKARTIITLLADIAAFKVTNVNDVEVFDFLIIANAAQTEPIIQLLATTVTITRNNFRGIQISGSAQTFTAIRFKTTTGAWGIWNNIFDDFSIGGVGTVVELNTAYAFSWINSNRFTNFYVGDFVKGIELVNSAGDGSSHNSFRDWGAQCSARTTYGLLIPNSTPGHNRNNLLDGVSWYDMQAGGEYYSIGTGVIGTTVRFPRGDPDISKITDNGTQTNIDSKIRYFLGQVWFKESIIFETSNTSIAAPGADDSYITFTARDNGVGGVEVARLQGGADPYFKAGNAVFLESGNSIFGGNSDLGSILGIVGLPAYANNTAAAGAGLSVGALYRTNGDPDLVCVVH